MRNVLERVKNWKTTACGVVIATLISVGSELAQGERDTRVIAGSTILAVVGSLMRDPEL